MDGGVSVIWVDADEVAEVRRAAVQLLEVAGGAAA